MIKIKNTFVFLTILASLAFSSSYAKESPSDFDSIEKLTQWMNHYYLNRDSSGVLPAIRAMFKYGLLVQESARLPGEAFLGSVFYQNHKKVEGWLQELKDLNLEQKKILWEAIRFSGDPQGEILLKKIKSKDTREAAKFIDRLLNEEKKPLLSVEITTPVILDMLWAQFLASGDERCVKRVIDALGLFEEKEDARKVLVGGAAKWSLMSNAIQHERVLDICKQELPSRLGPVKSSLTEIIQKAEKNLAHNPSSLS